MNRNILMYLSIALILLIPVPGRFAYGIVMAIEFLVLMVLGILFRRLIKKIRMEEFKGFLIPLAMVASSVIFKQLLILISPIMAFTLGFAVYMPAISAFVLENISDERKSSPLSEIKKSVLQTLSVVLPVLIIFLVRDLIGYGTLTLPAKNSLFVVHIIPEIQGSFLPTVFLASIPGAFLLLALSLLVVTKIGVKWTKESDITMQNGKEDSEENQENMDQRKADPEVEPVQTIESFGQNQENVSSEIKIEETDPVQKTENQQQNPFDLERLRGLDTSNISDSLSFPDAPSLLNLDDIMGDNYGN